MESNWRIRLLLAVILLMILAACDYLGAILDEEISSGRAGSSIKSNNKAKQIESGAKRRPASFMEDAPRLDVVTDDDDADDDDFGQTSRQRSVRADCLPKLVCELAGQPDAELGHRERHLLDMIRSSGIGNTAEVASRWHFAVHMGQLLADTQGCAALWSGCPLAHDTLLGLARRLTLKR